jgi:phosphoenolpyruvate-protein phosphotransferase (PTS system enzyme I)
MSIQLFGVNVSRGIAIGRAVLIGSGRVDVDHYYIAPEQIDAEVSRLMAACDQVSDELEHLQKDLPGDAPHELGALLDVHRMLLHDEALIGAAAGWIRERHYNAEWALAAQLDVLSRQFDEMEDEYLRERKSDVEQVVERVLLLMRRSRSPGDVLADGHGEEPLVLIASDISPADLLHFKRSIFQGFVTDVGGRTSHTAIVARSMDIPAVVGAREASRLTCQDDWVIIDGEVGVVIVNPPPIVLDEYRFRQRQAQIERERLDRLRNTPAVTLDGERIELLANIELPQDAPAALMAGAMGVGLFRSEFLFMNRDGVLPDEDEQFEAYRSAVVAMQGLPVTIRTIDIGADKALDRPGGHDTRHEHGLNPALGLRAIRWSLAEPSMFRQQIRAILRAAAFGKVRMLIPMIAQGGEIRLTWEAIRRAQAQLDEAGKAYGSVEVGAMVEVPAAAIHVQMLLDHFDFLSIGTNDLIQYTLAIDRADESVAHLYDPWHPAVLWLIERTIKAGAQRNKPVSVCGEMAGDPGFTEELLGMGLRSFSMHPTQMAAVKQRILRIDLNRLSRRPITHALVAVVE